MKMKWQLLLSNAAILLLFLPRNKAANEQPLVVYSTLPHSNFPAVVKTFQNTYVAKSMCLQNRSIQLKSYPQLAEPSSYEEYKQIENELNVSSVVLLIGQEVLYDSVFFNLTSNFSGLPVRTVKGFDITQESLGALAFFLYSNINLPSSDLCILASSKFRQSLWANFFNTYHSNLKFIKYAKDTKHIGQNLRATNMRNFLTDIDYTEFTNIRSQLVRYNLNAWYYRWIFLSPELARIASSDEFFNSANITTLGIGLNSVGNSINMAPEDVLYADLMAAAVLILEYELCNTTLPSASIQYSSGEFNFADYSSKVSLSVRQTYQYLLPSNYSNETCAFNSTRVLEMRNPSKWEFCPSSFQLSPSPADRASVLKRLQQRTLRLLGVHSPPYVWINETAPADKPSVPVVGKNLVAYGLAVEIVMKIMSNLNLTYQFYSNESQGFGTLENNEWTGLIGEIYSENYDLAVSMFAYSFKRAQAVNFLETLVFVTSSFLTKPITPSFLQEIFQFTYPFELYVWIVILGSTVVYSLVLSLVHLISPNVNNFNVNESVFFIWGSLLQGTTVASPDRVSGRVLTCFWWLFNIIIMVTFVANYGAYRTNLRLQVELLDLRDLQIQDSYKFGTIKNSNIDFEFAQSEYELMVQLNQTLRNEFSDYLFENLTLAIDAVRQGRFAFILDEPVNEYYANLYCLKSSGSFSQIDSSFLISKNAEYAFLLNEQIRILLNEGFVDVKQAEYYSVNPKVKCDEDVAPWLSTLLKAIAFDYFTSSSDALTFYSTGGIFVIMIAGCVLSLLLAAIELIVRLIVKLIKFIRAKREDAANGLKNAAKE